MVGGDGGDVGGFRCDAAELIASELLPVGRRIKPYLSFNKALLKL